MKTKPLTKEFMDDELYILSLLNEGGDPSKCCINDSDSNVDSIKYFKQKNSELKYKYKMQLPIEEKAKRRWVHLWKLFHDAFGFIPPNHDELLCEKDCIEIEVETKQYWESCDHILYKKDIDFGIDDDSSRPDVYEEIEKMLSNPEIENNQATNEPASKGGRLFKDMFNYDYWINQTPDIPFYTEEEKQQILGDETKEVYDYKFNPILEDIQKKHMYRYIKYITFMLFRLQQWEYFKKIGQMKYDHPEFDTKPENEQPKVPYQIHVEEYATKVRTEENFANMEWTDVLANLDSNGVYQNRDIMSTMFNVMTKEKLSPTHDSKDFSKTDDPSNPNQTETIEERKEDTIPLFKGEHVRSLKDVDVLSCYTIDEDIAYLKVMFAIERFLDEGHEDMPMIYPTYLPMSEAEEERAYWDSRHRMKHYFIPLSELGKDIIGYDINKLPEEQEAMSLFEVSAINIDIVKETLFKNMVPLYDLSHFNYDDYQSINLNGNFLVWFVKGQKTREGFDLDSIITPHNFIRNITPRMLLRLIKYNKVRGMTKYAYMPKEDVPDDWKWEHPSMDIFPKRLLVYRESLEPFYYKYYDDPEALIWYPNFRPISESGDLIPLTSVEDSYSLLTLRFAGYCLPDYYYLHAHLRWCYEHCKHPFSDNLPRNMMPSPFIHRELNELNKKEEEKMNVRFYYAFNRFQEMSPYTVPMQFQPTRIDISKDKDGSKKLWLPLFAPDTNLSIWNALFNSKYSPYMDGFIGYFLGPNFNPDEFFHYRLCEFMIKARSMKCRNYPVKFKNNSEVMYLTDPNHPHYNCHEREKHEEVLLYSASNNGHKYRFWDRHIQALDTVFAKELYYNRYYACDDTEFLPEIASMNTNLSQKLYLLNYEGQERFRKELVCRDAQGNPIGCESVYNHGALNVIMCHHLIPVNVYDKYINADPSTRNRINFFKEEYAGIDKKWIPLYKDPAKEINFNKLLEYKDIDIEQKVRMDTYFWAIRKQLEPFELFFTYYSEFVVPRQYYESKGIPLPKWFKEYDRDEGFIGFFDWSGNCWRVNDPWNLPEKCTHMNQFLFSFHKNIGYSEENRPKHGSKFRIVDCECLYIPINSTGCSRNNDLPYFNIYERNSDNRFNTPKLSNDVIIGKDQNGNNIYQPLYFFSNALNSWCEMSSDYSSYHKCVFPFERTFWEKGRTLLTIKPFVSEWKVPLKWDDTLKDKLHYSKDGYYLDYYFTEKYLQGPWDLEFPKIKPFPYEEPVKPVMKEWDNVDDKALFELEHKQELREFALKERAWRRIKDDNCWHPIPNDNELNKLI